MLDATQSKPRRGRGKEHPGSSGERVPTHTPSPLSVLWGSLAAFLLLTPFLGKPLHMDAPLIVWAAQQIRRSPLDFYGVAVNWFGTTEGLDRILRMPPLFSMMVAPFVTHERVLPLLPFAGAVVAALGIGVLAREWGAHPLWAGVAAVCTPAFVVCGSLVMPDMALLAFWTWAVVFQVKGHKRPVWWVAAALCATGAVLTKYSGLAVVPLLALYSWRREQRLSPGLWALALPIIAMGTYQVHTGRLYGQGLFTEAAGYAFGYAPHTLGWFARKSMTTLSFSGGGFAVALFFLPLLWSGKTIARWAWGAVAVGAMALFLGTFESFSFLTPTHIRWGALAQMALWVTGGAHLLTLAWMEWRFRRDAASLTVFAWLAGTMAFAAWFNWSVTVRALLPATPAVGIVLAWRAQRLQLSPKKWVWALVPAVGVALAAGGADARLAWAARETARQAALQKNAGETMWFEGHWGFQYYLEKTGARAVDYERIQITPRDILLIPLNNIRVVFPDRNQMDLIATLSVPGPFGLTVHHGALGAGFHSDYWGPLPLSLGRVPPEKTLILRPRVQ